jgi:hypothetical protein
VRHHPRFGSPFYGGAVPPAYARAYAEGRRQREAAWARRHRHRGALPFALLLLLALPILTGGDEVVVAALAGLGVTVGMIILVAMAAPALTVGTLAFVLIRRGRRRAALRRGGAAGTAPLPARPAAAPRPDRVWAHAQRRFHGLRTEYAAYECDAMQVLRLPALADVSVGSTARFVDAFAEAQALETDRFPGGGHAESFVAAVDRADRAWRAARDAAERIRLSGLNPAERSTVERVIKLLTTARDSDNDAERLAAYARARSELLKLDKAGVVHVPLPARSALDEATRGTLPA